MLNDNWISVNDKLPGDGEDYLVCDAMGAMAVIPFEPYLKKWNETLISFWDNSDEITHWMPLPEPPAKNNLD